MPGIVRKMRPKQSSQSKRKKERELRHLARFLELRPGIASVRDEGPEPPDFLLHGREGQAICLEVTELYHRGKSGGDSLQAQERLRQQVAQKAQRCFEELEPSRPSLHVSIHFSTGNPLTKRGTTDVALAIAQAVDDHLPPPGEHRIVQSEWSLDRSLPDQVWALNIYHLADEPRTSWTVPGATYVPVLDSMYLTHHLEKKSKMVAKYKAKCEENWLLLVTTGFHLAGLFVINMQQLALVGRGSFDRVFLLHEYCKVYELGP